MKKILGLFIIGVSFFGCIDEDILDGPAMAFYPTIAIEAIEQDTTQYSVILEATGKLNGDAAITIKFDNHEFIETVPAHTNGVLKVEVGSEGTAEFTVEALNDDFPESYTATFRVTGTEGAVTGIVNSIFSFIVKDDDVESVFFEDFETNGLNDWETEVIGAGDDWSTGDFSGNTYADISNFNANAVSESWLISKKIDFVSEENEMLIFETQARFNDGGEILTAYIITGYTPGMNPTDATLTELTFERDPHEGGGFGNFTTSGAIDLSHIDEVGRIAFYYKAASSSDGSGWSVDNVIVQSFDPNNSGPEPEPTTFSLPFTDDLDACGDFSIPANFTQERIPGSKQDRGWACSGNGMSGSQAVRASAAGGETGTVEAWLISAKAFDLGSTSMATLSFDAKSASAGSGELNILWSSNYTGAGDPSSATWSEFTGVMLPAGGVDVYAAVEVDMADAIGNEAYIAFQFVGGTNTSSISYDIDNISISSGSGGGGGGGSIDISNARTLAGQVVTIKGIVTTPDFGFNNDVYFVQDATGGIGIINNNDEGVNMGDEVEITGTVGDFNGQVQINLSSINVLSTGNSLPNQINITSTDLVVNSSLQGSRVTLPGVTLDDPSAWPTSPIMTSSGLSVDATVGTTSFVIRIDRGESFYDGSTAPVGTFSITGILTRFNDSVQIMPFVDGDIQ